MTQSRQQLIKDILFVIQIIGAVLFCGAQFCRALVDVKGISLAQVGAVATYLLLHLTLALDDHRHEPSRGSRQLLATYSTWFGLIVAIIGAILANGYYRWSVQDTTTVLVALGLALLILAFGSWRYLGMRDPIIKAFLAIAFKSIPQVLLAWKILVEGGSGIPALSIWVGHATILIRLGQIYFRYKEKGWTPELFWLAISESCNELSWVVATTAWLVV